MEPHGHLSFVVLIAYSSLVYDNMHDSRIRKIFFFSNILSMAFSIDMNQVSIMIHIDIQLSESESESDSPVLVGAIEIQWAISGILAGHGRVATKGKNCSSFFFLSHIVATRTQTDKREVPFSGSFSVVCCF